MKIMSIVKEKHQGNMNISAATKKTKNYIFNIFQAMIVNFYQERLLYSEKLYFIFLIFSFNKKSFTQTSH